MRNSHYHMDFASSQSKFQLMYSSTTKNRAISLASPGRRFGRMARNISLYHESVEWLHLSLTKKLDVDSGRCSYIELINNLSSLIRALEYLPTLDCNLCV